MCKIMSDGVTPLKFSCVFLYCLVIWFLKVKSCSCDENEVQGLVNTNKQLENALSVQDKFFRIQCAASKKFLTVEEGSQNKLDLDSQDLSQSQQPFDGNKKNFTLVPGITVDIDYEKRPNLAHLKDNQIWRIRQSIGFPFRNESFSPLYKIQSLSTLDQPKNGLLETPWQLLNIGSKGNWQIFQIGRPFKNECATESQDELVYDQCEKTDGYSSWIFIPTTATKSSLTGTASEETEDFDTYNTAEVR